MSNNNNNGNECSSNNKKFIFASCQLMVTDNKELNLENAKEKIIEAVEKHKANVITLPECWNCPYSNACFPDYAENVEENEGKNAPSYQLLSSLAKEYKVIIIGGSIPEKTGDNKIYNTCFSFDKEGKQIGRFRKIHLFDIDIPNKITFKESDTLSPGKDFCLLETEYCSIGIGICFDIRFPELARVYQKLGAKLLVYPGAFNLTTGPAHWELLQRARSVDYQVYVATASPARDMNASYNAWGHSSIVNPFGEVIATTDHDPSIVSAEIDINYVDEIRTNIPTINTLKINSESMTIAD